MARKDQSHAEAPHSSSLIIIGHDHLTDEEHLLAMHSAGLAAKIMHVAVDAYVWASPAVRERSMHEYTGWTDPALTEIERTRSIIEKHPDELCLALTAADVERAHQGGRSAIILGFEGGKPIEQSLELLHIFHCLGLRMMQLTWAGGNHICDRRDPPACEGLTDFGREVVREMNRLGMLIDPGHCSRKTFFQVLELSEQPVCALHSIPRGTKPGPGDLDDEQIRALAQSGGVIGLHFFSHLLNAERKATLDDIVDHADYIADLVGIDHVALGADYLELTDEFIQGHGLPPSGFLGIPEDFDTYDKLIKVTEAFCARGYSDENVREVLGGNLMRVLHTVFGE